MTIKEFALDALTRDALGLNLWQSLLLLGGVIALAFAFVRKQERRDSTNHRNSIKDNSKK